jgi:hypothetical protein
MALREQPSARPVVVGVADHNGWMVLVSTAATNGEPVVIDRRRVPLIEQDVPSQPYHHETLAMGNDESEQLLRRVRRSITICTDKAFDHLTADLGPGYRVAALTLREPPLPHLPKTVAEVHASYHVTCRADGMLYHSAICNAASRRGWELVLHRRGEGVERAAEALKTRPGDVERMVKEMGRTLGPPWSAEHRAAFASAVAVLKRHTRLRALSA